MSVRTRGTVTSRNLLQLRGIDVHHVRDDERTSLRAKGTERSITDGSERPVVDLKLCLRMGASVEAPVQPTSVSVLGSTIHLFHLQQFNFEMQGRPWRNDGRETPIAVTEVAGDLQFDLAPLLDELQPFSPSRNHSTKRE